jgi:hypothetical protein
LIAKVCRDTKWTHRYVLEEVPVSLLLDLAEDWRLFPPVHIFISKYLGYVPPEPPQIESGARDVMAGVRAELSRFLRPGGKISGQQ